MTQDQELSEILADFSDGIAAEQAWVDARQALLQWRDKAVVEAKQELRERFGIDANKKYKVHYNDKAIIAQVIEETPNED